MLLRSPRKRTASLDAMFAAVAAEREPELEPRPVFEFASQRVKVRVAMICPALCDQLSNHTCRGGICIYCELASLAQASVLIDKRRKALWRGY